MKTAKVFGVVFGLFIAGFGRGAENYFPLPDDRGGWRQARDAAEARRVAAIDTAQLDAAFALIQGSSKNGGLLVVRNGWLVYERYFGLGHREATPNLASCGKSFTSIAVGMLLATNFAGCIGDRHGHLLVMRQGLLDLPD